MEDGTNIVKPVNAIDLEISNVVGVDFGVLFDFFDQVEGLLAVAGNKTIQQQA